MTSLSRAEDGRRRGGLAWPLPLFVVLLLGSALASALLAPARPVAAAPVAGQDLTIYAGPGSEFEPIGYAPAGSAISVDGDAVDGYVPVSHNGVSGWAADWAVAFDAAPAVVDEWVDPAAVAAEPAPLTEEPVPVYEEPAPIYEAPVAVYEEPALVEPVYEEAVFVEPVAEAIPAEGGDLGSAATGEEAIIQMIYAAADTYGQSPGDMLRVARCESNLDPNAINGPGDTHGLFQFLPGTFAGTPYADSSIYDPWANAHAAGWMWSQGRRNEWVCQ